MSQAKMLDEVIELVDYWREMAETANKYGKEDRAAVLNACADDLEERLQ